MITLKPEQEAYRKMYREKEMFVSKINWALTTYLAEARRDISEIKYICNGDTETVVISDSRGGNRRINVTGNSLNAIENEIFREIYGDGAHGRY